MRDILVLAIVLGSVPFCFFSPYFGVLMWVWVAYFNPHRFTFGMAYNFPVAMVIAVPTLAGMIFTRKVNRGLFVRETVMLLVFWAWICFTYFNATQVPLFADHTADAWVTLIAVSKVLLMTFLTIRVVTSRKRLETLFIVIALSFGALAIKGTLFGVHTGGDFRVWGPPNSFVYDNNDLGLALIMTLPVMFYMAREASSRWLRRALWACFCCSIFTVILSYSRGALLGLVVVLGTLALKSKRKILASALLVSLAFCVVALAPAAWMDRMNNFAQGNLDASAQGRLNAWTFAWRFASQYPITGGGFDTFTPSLEERFAPEFPFAGPHSIYFQTLGEQGFVGLGIWLFLLGGCLWSLWLLRMRVRGQRAFAWVANYSHMLQTCLVGYMVSGAFLPRAYFDLWFELVAGTAVLKILYERERAHQLTEEVASPTDAVLEVVAAG
jgi:putative inorganic carbon (hco3(-)) transporter